MCNKKDEKHSKQTNLNKYKGIISLLFNVCFLEKDIDWNILLYNVSQPPDKQIYAAQITMKIFYRRASLI